MSCRNSGRAFANNWERVPRDLSRPAMSWNIVAGNSFGKLGIVGALTFSNSLHSIFDQERKYYFPNPLAATDPGNAGPPVLQSEFDYDESTESARLGGVLNLSYQFTPAHKLSLKNFFSRDTDDNARYYEGYYQDFNTDIRNQRLRFIARTIQNTQLSGEHLFTGLGNSVLSWGMAYSKAARDEPDLRESLQIFQPRTEKFVFFDDSQSAFSHVQRLGRDHPQPERGHDGALLPRRPQRRGALRRELLVARAQLQFAALPPQLAQHARDRARPAAQRAVLRRQHPPARVRAERGRPASPTPTGARATCSATTGWSS